MNPLLDLPYPSMNVPGLLAVDTETTLFDNPVYGWKSATRIKPFGGHHLVLGSIAGAGRLRVLDPTLLVDAIWDALVEGAHLVFHNCAFDIPVLCRAYPGLEGHFINAVSEGRIHDTMILEALIQIARGSHTVNHRDLVRAYTLKDLAKRRTGMELQKGNERITFGQWEGQLERIPQDYLDYAARDAEATYRVYQAQLLQANLLKHQPNCRYPVLPDAEKEFGLLTEKIQVMGALALEWLERHPVRVDQEEATRVRFRLENEAAKLETALITYGWGRRGKKTLKFSLSHKKLRTLLAEYAQAHLFVPERSKTGLISLTYDFWAEYLPRASEHVLSQPELAHSIEDKFGVWLRYMRVHKLLASYIHPYSSSPVHYPRYFNIGARTTRTSASCPPVQQVPKRRDGIRGLFIPQPGYVLIEADFKAAELVALAQVYHLMFGGSALGTAINDGKDPHIETARRMRPDFDELPGDEKKRFRQAAKAVNFGLPGGLGARKFRKYAHQSYGLVLSEEEARNLRYKALDADPELRAYLAEKETLQGRLELAARNLGMTKAQLVTHLRAWQNEEEGIIRESFVRRRLRALSKGQLEWQIPMPPGFQPEYDLFRTTVRTPTGLVRGNASYTEAHNTAFQGTVAHAAKLALFYLYAASRFYTKNNFNPVAFVHDSILIEVRKGHEEWAAEILANCMKEAMKKVCPDVLGDVEVTPPMERWGVNTNAAGTELKEAA